jgi:hypothetical protein
MLRSRSMHAKFAWQRIHPVLFLAVLALLFELSSIGEAFGQQGFALQFDGADDYVAVPDTGDFDFGAAFTVEAWVKPFSFESSGNFKALIQGAFSEPPFSGGGWVLFLHSVDHSLFGLSVCVPECEAAESGPGDLSIDAWRHVAGVYDAERITVFRDGVEISSKPHGGDVTDVDVLLLGTWETSFHGLMDEVRIWNIPRTQAELRADMDRKLGGDESGLVAYWDFDEGEGQIVSDVTANKNDGRLGSTLDPDDRDPLWVRVSDDAVPVFRRGDSIDDGVANLSDAIYTLRHLFLGGPEIGCLEAADCDDSGAVDLTDAVLLLGHLFRGGPSPPAPEPGGPCGQDPAGSPSLGCVDYSGC